MKNSQNKPLGLPRSEILRGKSNFQRIFSQGNTIRAKLVDLRYVTFVSDSEAECKVAFITGRKLGKAVHRNKIRRQMREAYRLHHHTLEAVSKNTKTSVHLALMAKRVHVSFTDVEYDVTFLLSRLGDYISGESNMHES